MGGAVTASCTYPQQRQVPYAPYQSRSMIMEPRQRGQVRGSDVFMQAGPFQSASATLPPGAEALRLPGAWVVPHSVAYEVSCRVRAERLPYSRLRDSPQSACPRTLVPPLHRWRLWSTSMDSA
jgi:hypothetical protein